MNAQPVQAEIDDHVAMTDPEAQSEDTTQLSEVIQPSVPRASEPEQIVSSST